MINIHTEQIMGLKEARSIIPGNPAPATLWRWRTRGVRGAKLETVVVGNRRYTSREAVSRFVEAMNGPRVGAQRDKRLVDAERKLDSLGI